MKKTKTGISASMSSYQRVMARLERLSRRVDVVRGAPMSVKAIDAMEKKLRVKLGAEYRTFLQETGSLEEIFLERAKSRISR